MTESELWQNSLWLEVFLVISVATPLVDMFGDTLTYGAWRSRHCDVISVATPLCLWAMCHDTAGRSTVT